MQNFHFLEQRKNKAVQYGFKASITSIPSAAKVQLCCDLVCPVTNGSDKNLGLRNLKLNRSELCNFASLLCNITSYQYGVHVHQYVIVHQNADPNRPSRWMRRADLIYWISSSPYLAPATRFWKCIYKILCTVICWTQYKNQMIKSHRLCAALIMILWRTSTKTLKIVNSFLWEKQVDISDI